jgi:uncharacterized membrane protein (UPF0127 family)
MTNIGTETAMSAFTVSAGRRSLVRVGALAVTVLSLAIALTAAENPAALDEAALIIEASGKRFEFQVELAETPTERARGLMFRESLADDHGMLFDFGRPQPVAMWMRNTLIPLDILFIRSDGRISRITRDAQPLSDRVLQSGEPVRAVLELRGGLTAERNIQPGDRIIHPLFDEP